MENPISFNQLVRNTCIKIGGQFFLSILLLYLFPLLSLSINVTGVSYMGKRNPGAIFFNAFSWMYICLALILIMSFNIRKMLGIIKKEMDTVYHKSMWIEPRQNSDKLILKEFIQTDNKIEKMQIQIKEMIADEKKQKEDLIFKVSAASHDLKTPLTVIQGNSDLLLYSDLKKEQRACLEDIVTASKKIDNYFNALIHYSKTFYDDKSESRQYSISDVVEALEQEVYYLLKDKSVLKFIKNIEKERIVTLNLNYLLRAVSNVISNAVEYSYSKNKKIELKVSYENGRLIFSVWNNGSYFSQELLDNYDKLFYRYNKERNGNNSHYGIGLAFVKRVAKLHSGDLKITNLNDGVEVVLELKVD